MNNVLTNVEVIALKMQSHPGESGRFYRRAIAQYKNPRLWRASGWYRRGDNYNQYFRRHGHGNGRYWKDQAPRTVKDPMPWYPIKPEMKPKVSEWYLTKEGWTIANRARRKLGLEPIPHPTERVQKHAGMC